LNQPLVLVENNAISGVFSGHAFGSTLLMGLGELANCAKFKRNIAFFIPFCVKVFAFCLVDSG